MPFGISRSMDEGLPPAVFDDEVSSCGSSVEVPRSSAPKRRPTAPIWKFGKSSESLRSDKTPKGATPFTPRHGPGADADALSSCGSSLEASSSHGWRASDAKVGASTCLVSRSVSVESSRSTRTCTHRGSCSSGTRDSLSTRSSLRDGAAPRGSSSEGKGEASLEAPVGTPRVSLRNDKRAASPQTRPNTVLQDCRESLEVCTEEAKQIRYDTVALVAALQGYTVPCAEPDAFHAPTPQSSQLPHSAMHSGLSEAVEELRQTKNDLEAQLHVAETRAEELQSKLRELRSPLSGHIDELTSGTDDRTAPSLDCGKSSSEERVASCSSATSQASMSRIVGDADAKVARLRRDDGV